jgi:hypothetical protein
MKNKYLLLVCLFLCSIMFASAQQPLTITRQNFYYPAGSDTLNSATLEGVKIPEEGPNKVWDYTNLVAPQTVYNTYEVRSNPSFPNAAFFVVDAFDVFALNRGYYYDVAFGVTDAGYFGAGVSIAYQPYGIGDITGNALDSLNFSAMDNVYANPQYILRFPCTYGTVFTNSYSYDVPFTLTIGAYALNKAPGVKRKTLTDIDSVVGWGTLKLPARGGQFGAVNALLIKRYTTAVDSFFLYGQPAPEALLTAFQLTQGATTKYGRYVFYRENSRCYALSLNFNNHVFESAGAVIYDDAIPGNLTDVKEPPADATHPEVYPNPSQNGVFTIAAAQPVSSIVIRNILGMEVLRQDARQGALTVSLPPSSIPGMYFYQLKDARGAVVQTGKLLFTK